MTASSRTIRVAIIDSDSGFEKVLTKRMDAAGWEHRVHPGAVPVGDLVSMKLSALVVDPAVLGDHSWQLLEEVCAALPGLGVLVCTQQSTVAQRVRGLRVGADDWVTKPCHPEELIARIEAVVRRRRRSEARSDSGPLVLGEMEVRHDQFQAFVGGQSAELTRREFELLAVLADARGSVVEREDVYQRVWGYAMARGDRSVDVFVRKLRQKLRRLSPGWDYIHTHFAVGYRFEPEPLVEEADVPAGIQRPATAGEAGAPFEDGEPVPASPGARAGIAGS